MTTCGCANQAELIDASDVHDRYANLQIAKVSEDK
jgi:hypothetical protein